MTNHKQGIALQGPKESFSQQGRKGHKEGFSIFALSSLGPSQMNSSFQKFRRLPTRKSSVGAKSL
jgi:hypothetical protein